MVFFGGQLSGANVWTRAEITSSSGGNVTDSVAAFHARSVMRTNHGRTNHRSRAHAVLPAITSKQECAEKAKSRRSLNKVNAVSANVSHLRIRRSSANRARFDDISRDRRRRYD